MKFSTELAHIIIEGSAKFHTLNSWEEGWATVEAVHLAEIFGWVTNYCPLPFPPSCTVFIPCHHEIWHRADQHHHWGFCQVSYLKSIRGMSHSRSSEFGGDLWFRDPLLSIAMSALTHSIHILPLWNLAQSWYTSSLRVLPSFIPKIHLGMSHSSNSEFGGYLWFRDLFLSIVISALVCCIHSLSSFNSMRAGLHHHWGICQVSCSKSIGGMGHSSSSEFGEIYERIL
jgi:hypothetical protein